jgi:hypothetical protein
MSNSGVGNSTWSLEFINFGFFPGATAISKEGVILSLLN